MSKKTKEAPKSDGLIKSLINQFDSDFDALSTERSSWEDKEKSIQGLPVDSFTSSNPNAKVNDMSMHTAIVKRTNSTVGQLPTGKSQALTKADAGKNMAMDFTLQKYVIPNAKTQFDMFTKAWMMEFYSLWFGEYDVLVDYVVSDKYVGPDWWLIPKRKGIPQRGRVSIDDCERYFVISSVSKSWLLKRDTKNWKNIDKLLEKDHGKKDDTELQSYNERKFGDSSTGGVKDDDENIEIITRYEGDRWVTFSKDAKLVLRDIENKGIPGELPIVQKHCFPLIDRYNGLAEYERLNSLQNSINSLINLYLDGVKMSIFPPLKLYLPDLVPSTIVNEPGAKWVLKNMNPNAISEMLRSPQGINSFQSTYSFLKAALLNAAGTTDVTNSQGMDLAMGRTPQALKMQQAFDSSRSNFDQKMMDQSMGRIFEKMVNLIATKQDKPIKFNLFKQELDMIAKYNPDLTEMYESGKYGEVTIKPEFFKDKEKVVKYRFMIDPSTTVKKEQAIENDTLTSILQLLFKVPGAMEQVIKTGYVMMGNKRIDVGEALSRWVVTSGIQDPEKIVSEVKPEEMAAMQSNQGQMPGTLPGMGQGVPQPPGMPQNGATTPMMPGQMPTNAMPQANFERPPLNQMGNDLSPEAMQIISRLRGE